jgi:hypothetical protein
VRRGAAKHSAGATTLFCTQPKSGSNSAKYPTTIITKLSSPPPGRRVMALLNSSSDLTRSTVNTKDSKKLMVTKDIFKKKYT